ncbi:AAA family ATPase [Actinopolymorpha cephalotaxi]|nr:MoxR family ATPase [Actinopolymorpha cephalotaxi]NYH83115.1 MoxR-like ATPase [Actinopolymorpha cephalotaxi]
MAEALAEIKRVIVGQDHMVERLMVALLARGHCLLEGVPGVAKTLAVRTFATVVGGDFARLQFTPDLVPSDIVGTRIYRPSKESFDVELGPVFVNFVLADEVNRAPAKVQSAMLELMAERQVSVGGRTFPLPLPFIVIATQNPLESEGVYPLPEAQRDRFLVKVDVHLPDAEQEFRILERMSVDPPTPRRVLDPERIIALQHATDQVFVHRLVADYIVRLVLATRRPAEYHLPELASVIEVGASPRASLGLVSSARALALMRGRDYVLPQDVQEVACDVIPHRLVLGFDAVADGVRASSVVERVLSVVPPPRPVWRQEPGDTAEPNQPGHAQPSQPSQPGQPSQSSQPGQPHQQPNQPNQPAQPGDDGDGGHGGARRPEFR